jgi:hypothetical protein
MEQAGLRVEFCRPLFGCLVPGLLVRRNLKLRDPETLLRMFLQPPPAPLNALLRGVTAFEVHLTHLGLAVFGSSWLALGRSA